MKENNSYEHIVKKIYKSRKTIFRWVRKNSGSQQDAEDVLQESIIILLDYLDQDKLNELIDPIPLFTTISHRYWLGKLRKRKFSNVPIDNLNISSDIIEGIEIAIEKESMHIASSEALEKLGDKCKELLKMFYFNGLDMTTIAKKLDFRNEHVARSMKYKCLEKARTLIINNH